MDITREMMTINQVISGIHLVDSLQRPVNPQLAFQVQGTHWVLPIDSEVQKFAEEDIYLIIFDVFYNAGMELVRENSKQREKGPNSCFLKLMHFAFFTDSAIRSGDSLQQGNGRDCVSGKLLVSAPQIHS